MRKNPLRPLKGELGVIDFAEGLIIEKVFKLF